MPLYAVVLEGPEDNRNRSVLCGVLGDVDKFTEKRDLILYQQVLCRIREIAPKVVTSTKSSDWINNSETDTGA
jgi:hypothetical protein